MEWNQKKILFFFLLNGMFDWEGKKATAPRGQLILNQPNISFMNERKDGWWVSCGRHSINLFHCAANQTPLIHQFRLLPLLSFQRLIPFTSFGPPLHKEINFTIAFFNYGLSLAGGIQLISLIHKFINSIKLNCLRSHFN